MPRPLTSQMVAMTWSEETEWLFAQGVIHSLRLADII